MNFLTLFFLVAAAVAASAGVNSQIYSRSSFQPPTTVYTMPATSPFQSVYTSPFLQQSPLYQAPLTDKQVKNLEANLLTALILNTIHHYNNLEIIIVQESRAKLSTPSAINLADTLERDHSESETMVQQVAASLAIQLYPFQQNTAELAMAGELAKLSGAEFEFAFASSQATGHDIGLAQMNTLQSALTRFQGQHGISMNAGLTSLMASSFQVLIKHREMATAVMNELTGQQPASLVTKQYY